MNPSAVPVLIPHIILARWQAAFGADSIHGIIYDDVDDIVPAFFDRIGVGRWRDGIDGRRTNHSFDVVGAEIIRRLNESGVSGAALISDEKGPTYALWQLAVTRCTKYIDERPIGFDAKPFREIEGHLLAWAGSFQDSVIFKRREATLPILQPHFWDHEQELDCVLRHIIRRIAA
jgi:hypothetical protein